MESVCKCAQPCDSSIAQHSPDWHNESLSICQTSPQHLAGIHTLGTKNWETYAWRSSLLGPAILPASMASINGLSAYHHMT